MSKAFTRESDDLPDLPPPPSRAPLLPLGVKNYMTPAGQRRLQKELDRLIQFDRPRLAALATGDDGKRELHALDQRLHHLHQSLESAVVVTPPAASEERVRFGATVAVRDAKGNESKYRIVGVDETDLDRNWISWLSPIAKALVNARLKQRVRFKFPAGEEELEIVRINYEAF